MKKYFILFILLLTACDNNKISLNNDYNKNIKKEYINVFLDDDNITTIDDGNNKLSLLLFGMDGCSACYAMNRLLSEKGTLSQLLISNYKPYYINLSHKKEWIMNDEIISIEKFKKEFMIVGTPTLAIMYGKKILLIYPGYIDKNRLKHTLTFFLNKEIYEYDEKTIVKKLQEYYKENNI